MNIIIPMAGRGSRFADHDKPKPLIEAKGKTLLEWSLLSFQPFPNAKFIFVALQEHEEIPEAITEIMGRLFPEAIYHTILIEDVTRGQAETVLKAKAYIDNDDGIIIFNSDTYSPSTELVGQTQDSSIDGSLVCFEATDPRYSFAKVENGRVVQTTEKDPISSHASNGMYYFAKGSDFVQYAEKMIERNEKTGGEFYVAPLYNDLITDGKHIVIAACDANHVLGTPEELATFESQEIQLPTPSDDQS